MTTTMPAFPRALSNSRRFTRRLVLFALAVVAAAQVPMFVSGEPFSPDVLFLAVPNAHFLGEQLRAGHLPLWDPYLLGGHPFLAELQTQVLYPPSLLWAFVDPRRWMGAFLALHLVFGAAGAFVMGRAFRLRPESSAVVALAMGLSPLIVEHYQHPNLLCALSWLPWMWAIARRLSRRPTPRLAAALAVVWACAFTAGAPELAACAAIGAVWIARRRIGWLALGLATGALLAAPAWLPFLELLRHSERAAGVPFAEVCHFELHRLEVVDLFAPFAQYAEAPGLHDHYFQQFFLGASVAVLAFAARRRLWLLLAAALLVISLGDETPLFHLLWSILPPLHAVRSPIKLAGLMAVLLSLRAGWGLQRWAAHGGRKAWTMALGFAALACLGFAADGLSGTAAPWASSAAWSGTAAALLLSTWSLPHSEMRRWAALIVVAAELVAFNLGVTRQILHAGPPCAASPELRPDGRILFDVGAGVRPPSDWTSLCELGWDNRNILAHVASVSGFVAPAPAGIHELLRADVPKLARTYRPSVVVLGDDVDRAHYPPGKRLLQRGRFTAYEIGPPLRAMLRTAQGEVAVNAETGPPGAESFTLPGESGVLTVFDTAFPGWQARIDGHAAQMEARDGIDVIQVPRGSRRLDLVYAPRSFLYGLGLFAMGLLACLVAIGWGGVWLRGPHAPAPTRARERAQ